MIFSQQLISPKLLYLGNPEDLRGGVRDIFARKVKQIPNLETVFDSEQIFFQNFKNNGRIMVESDIMNGFLKFLVSSRTNMSQTTFFHLAF